MSPTGLWRHPDFLKLWAGQTVSRFGSQVSELALPLTAVLVLQATPMEMGLLGAAERAPFLLVGLLVGVWIDRMRRRPVLIVGDFARGVLLLTIPAAALAGALRIEQLYLVGFLVGVLTVFFDVAYQSYLAPLVGRERVVEGNSKLSVTDSLAQIAGPGVAGGLVGLVTAPVAILIDAASFFVSAASLLLIGQPESTPTPKEERASIGADVAEGLRVVFGNPLLRSIAICTATFNLFGNMGYALLVLYATRALGLDPGLLGLAFGLGGGGVLVGALIAGRTAGWLGVGPTIVGSTVVASVSQVLIPLAGGPLPVAMAMLVGAQVLGGMGNAIYNINQVSLRQTITPDRLQGRMNATMRFLVWGTLPIGALIGGWLGEAIGLRPTLFLGVAGMLCASGWIALSLVRHLREQPRVAVEVAA